MWWTTEMTISFGSVFQDCAAWEDFSRLALTPVCSQRFVEITEDSTTRGKLLLASCFSPQRNECCWAAGLIRNRDPFSPRLHLTTGDTRLFCVLKGSKQRRMPETGSGKVAMTPLHAFRHGKTCEWPKGHSAKARTCRHPDLSGTYCLHTDTDTLKGP